MDIGQIQLKAKFKEVYDMPFLHYSELLALSLGVAHEELALRNHKIDTDKFLE